MRRKSVSLDCFVIARLLPCLLYACTIRCTLSGIVVDRGRFETRLSDMRLQSPPMIRIYHGGSRRDIPLKLVSTVIIDPSTTITVGNELYFSADITLKNGTRLKSLDKDQTSSTKVFISVQNTLVGKSENERFVIGLEDVSRLTVR
jgi:hypothetical protein